MDGLATLMPLASLLLEATLETIVMVVASTAMASVIGVALGIVLVLTHRDGVVPRPLVHRVVGALVNVGRSVPFVILMVAIIPFTRFVTGTSIGTRAAIVPLVVAAIPYVARVAHAALEEVPRGLVDAIVAMGATPLQVVREAYLREARPALARGLTLTAISLVGYSAMAGAIGGGGLGDLAVRYGYQRFRTDVMVATVVVLVVLVQALQATGERLARRLDHR
ncbi:MAG: methionine ABC transporter permease [Myxococcales bacterium 68-20]|nr:MAG: methionine ABC transporter permease [Myxococcales bacterium 68-20]